jgi:hypothetical protein
VGRRISDAMGLPREMVDSFFPPVAASGHRFARAALRSNEEIVMLVAAGQLVHPTVASFLDCYSDESVVAVPADGLPPSRTALVWLSGNRSPSVQAFAQVAAPVLRDQDSHVELE